MARPKSLEPKYRYHKSTGQAYVVIDGKDVWLGKHGSRESRNKYHAVLSEWIARDRQGPAPAADGTPAASVSMVLASFWTFAKGYYKNPDGTSAGEVDNYRQAMRPLRQLYGSTPAAEFSPLKLKAVRIKMISPQAGGRPGWSRSHANRQIGRIKAIFKWAVEFELIPGAVYQALATVGGLRKGRSEAREAEPVTPAPEQQIEAVRDLVSEQVRAMIDLQLLTGARPGELCRLRTCDVDTSSAVWVYRPPVHKTAHHGHRCEIFIGPKAKQILAPLLKPDVQAYVFSPTDAERDRLVKLREARKTPVQPSQKERAKRSKRRRRARAPSDRYDVASYRRAIARACAKAFPPPEPLARAKGETAKAWRARLTVEERAKLARWAKDHNWHPHQLRHNAATRLRKEYGLEAAQVILGHKTLTVTEVYAEKNVAKARQIMGEVG